MKKSPDTSSGSVPTSSRAVACTPSSRLRAAWARHIEDPSFAELIETLLRRSPELKQWWSHHDVRSRTSGLKTIEHPQAGRMTLTHAVLHAAEAPEQKLVVYYAKPGSVDAERVSPAESEAWFVTGA